jgi:isopentenyl-diphosphate delta-isomerase
MEHNIIIIKFGGSIITDKSRPFSLRTDRISALCEQIARFYFEEIRKPNPRKILLVHGGGSFGHPMANQYEIHKGLNFKIQNQILGLSKTHSAMQKLNAEICNAMEQKSLPYLVFPPVICFEKSQNDNIKFKNQENLLQTIEMNIIPIFFGDIIFIKENNFGILSGDTIIEYFAENISWITQGTTKVSKIIYVFDQDGILYETESGERKIFDVLNPNLIDSFAELNLKKTIDVTGSIKNKLDSIAKIARCGVDIELINGFHDERLFESMKGWCAISSKFKKEYWPYRSEIHKRKDDHILLSLNYESKSVHTNWFEYLKLIHQAIPKYNLSEIDTSCKIFGKKMDLPLFIGALTGGTELAKKLNDRLSKSAQKSNIGMMLGSCRILFEYPDALDTFLIARRNAPDIPLVANIGISHISTPQNIEMLSSIISKLEADAIAIHFNALQELLQPYGTREFRELDKGIHNIAEKIGIPIIAKEVGNGFSKETVEWLYSNGIRIFDISGFGGTNFASIELSRSEDLSINEEDKNQFAEWGIPTAASLLEIVDHVKMKDLKITIITGGGIRSGIECVKALAIGADFISIAQPFIQKALESQEAVDRYISQIKNAVKYTMMLINAKNIEQIHESPYLIQEPLKNWVISRKDSCEQQRKTRTAN